MTKNSAAAAAIDIGTNGFRLLVAELEPGGTLKPLAKNRITVRLGEGLKQTKGLRPEAMERGKAALGSFAEIMARHQPTAFRACGTHALRQAANSRAFLRAAEGILGFPVEIISGNEEAALSLRGALHFLMPQDPGPIFLADVGGGSTELAWTDGRGEGGGASLALGAVNVTEQYFRPGAVLSHRDLAAMRRSVAGKLHGAAPGFPRAAAFDSAEFVGTGGGATALAAIALGLKEYDAEKVQGYKLSGQRLEKLYGRLVGLGPAARDRLPGLDAGRGAIIVASAIIYQELLKILAKTKILVSDAGLLEGILLSCVQDA